MTGNVAWAERAQRALTPNYRQQPLALVRGEGARVWDADGKEYLDFLGGVAVNVLGHCHPALVRALEEQARTLWHVSNHYFIPRQIELAEALLAVTPFARRAFFCNSGAEANEAMLKLARKYHADRGHPERNEIVSCVDSFHGRTLFTVTVGGQEKYQHGFEPLVPGVRHVPFGDLAALEAALDDRTAAFLVEPIQGESGVVPAPEGYLEAARELTRERGVLLCFDEVQTGIGRTGRMWFHEWTSVTPDLMSVAKGLGGGFPIGALLATEEVGAPPRRRQPRLDLRRQPARLRGRARRPAGAARRACSSGRARSARASGPGSRRSRPAAGSSGCAGGGCSSASSCAGSRRAR